MFSYSSHVVQRFQNGNRNFVQDTLRINYAKFHLNPFSSFRGENVWKIINDNNDHKQQSQRTPRDGNSSHGLWPGEIKMEALSRNNILWWTNIGSIKKIPSQLNYSKLKKQFRL